MATSSVETPSPDALSKLRIKRVESRTQRSWLNRLLRLTFMATAVLAGVESGVVLAARYGSIYAGGRWLWVQEVMQWRVECRLAAMTVESGRSDDATVVATGYLESRREAKIGARAPGRLEIIN